jgi:UDP-N-acetyl-D-glucosamine dehydrogenase
MLRTATKVSLADDLFSRIRLRTARIAVVGLGYVGLPLAEAFAAEEFRVIGFDLDTEKIKRLRNGESYIGHIGDDRIRALNEGGNFLPSADPSLLGEADILVICVPTPLTETREPDLSFVLAAGKAIASTLSRGRLIVLESSTYPGTTDELLRQTLEESGLRAGVDFFLAYSPEREDPGNRVHSTRTIPKVVGGIDETSGALAVALYETTIAEVIPVSSSRVAEACKILENTYRCVNIALVNELKTVFDAMGIDVWEVIAAAKTKPFGFQAFYPGPGLGGHCIPIDPFYLTWAARKYGLHTRFIELAGEVNAAMPRYVVERIAEALNEEGSPVRDSRICLLGAAYKKDVDDVRESPFFAILDLLKRRGASVSYNDPHVPLLKAGKHGVGLTSEPLTAEFLEEQDCVVVVTDHSAYNWDLIAEHARLIVDTRNALAALEKNRGARICKA